MDALSNALEVASNFKKGHPLHRQAEQLAEKWSAFSLIEARRQTDQGHFTQAISLLQKIPQSSKAYTDAQTMIEYWQRDWNKGKQVWQQAKLEINKKDWTQALLQVQALADLRGPYWQKRADMLLDEITIARQSS